MITSVDALFNSWDAKSLHFPRFCATSLLDCLLVGSIVVGETADYSGNAAKNL